MHLIKYKADSLGIFSAGLCIIHCMLIPVLVLAGLVNEETGSHTHWMDYFFILISGIAVYFATRQMNNKLIGRLMWVSTFWFATSILLHDMFSLALYSSMLASVFLLILHGLNFRQHQLQHQTRKATV